MGKMVGVFCIFFFFLIYGLELQFSSIGFILTLGKKAVAVIVLFLFSVIFHPSLPELF